MVVDHHLAGQNEGPRTLPGLNQTPLHQQLVKTFFFHQGGPSKVIQCLLEGL
jgi:hypothetical protein